MFTAEFAGQAARVVRPGGHLHIATDVEEYFGVMQKLVAGQLAFTAVPLPVPAEGEPEALTNFERKYQLEGRPIYRAVYERGGEETSTSSRNASSCRDLGTGL